MDQAEKSLVVFPGGWYTHFPYVWSLHMQREYATVGGMVRLDCFHLIISPIQYCSFANGSVCAHQPGNPPTGICRVKMEAGASVGQRSRHWEQIDQCPGRNGCGEAGFPEIHYAATLPDSG